NGSDNEAPAPIPTSSTADRSESAEHPHAPTVGDRGAGTPYVAGCRVAATAPARWSDQIALFAGLGAAAAAALRALALPQAAPDALAENVDGGCGTGVCGDTEGQLAEVREDRDRDLNVVADRGVGMCGHHPPA